MNPIDVSERDFNLYYANTWMLHCEHGPVYVQVDGRKLYFKAPDTGRLRLAHPSDLTCWWPRAGAYNTSEGKAVYIARRALRNMHKSATEGHHYYTKWGTRPKAGIMNVMKKGFNFIQYETALKSFEGGLITSSAISRDIIIHPEFPESFSIDNPRLCVVFRGVHTGVMVNGEFTPEIPNDPLSKRVFFRLLSIKEAA